VTRIFGKSVLLGNIQSGSAALLYSESQLDSKSQTDREVRYHQFVELLTGNDQAIRRFVRSLLPSRDGVDDVVQDTALECWKKFSDFEPSSPQDAVGDFARWACVIARYKVLSRHRDRTRDRLVFRETVVTQLAATAMENLEQCESERRAIDRCLMEMNDEQRRLVLSVHSPGESIARIADETGQKARRLYSKVNALRKLLLACVEQKLAENG